MNGSISPKLWCCFVASCALYAVLLLLGPRYALLVPVIERPLLLVIGLYLAAFAIYFLAIPIALLSESTTRLAWWVIGTSVVFRALLLPTPPFQEIDIYRYLWDGAVVVEGIDPYAFAPDRVVGGLDGLETSDQRLEQLVELAESRPALGDVVREIHFAKLPSPYPPVSQAIFASAAITTPSGWSAFGRLVWLKGWLILFDVATLALVIDLLRTTRMPLGWALAYGWCPLVLKEVAGSGHLDSIATCLTVTALAAGARVLVGRSGWRLGMVAACLLGLGVGAKLYPIVLAPLLAAGLLRHLGWRATVGGATAFLLTTIATLWPMLGISGEEALRKTQPVLADGVESLPPPPGGEIAEAEKTEGLTAFLTQWEMNDLLFMLVYENLRSQADVAINESPWFDVTPETWSERLRGDNAAAFKLTRAATLVVFGVIALWLAWRFSWSLDHSAESVAGWLRAAFLTLAWFWLLAPTQNPWYWCWAVPLLPWAGGRAWLAMSAVVMAYYWRFWLELYCPDPGLLGTAYNGEFFFYYVVPWLEFGPLLIWLAVETRTRSRLRPAGFVPRHTD